MRSPPPPQLPQHPQTLPHFPHFVQRVKRKEGSFNLLNEPLETYARMLMESMEQIYGEPEGDDPDPDDDFYDFDRWHDF